MEAPCRPWGSTSWREESSRPQVAEDFGFAMQLRQRADYSEDLPVTAADAQAVIRRAERFLSAVEGLLESS